MTIDNSTGKDKEFYNLGKQMFDRIQPLKPIKPYSAAIEADIELMWEVNSADIEALEDAKMTLNKALGMSYSDAMERVMDSARSMKK